MVAIIPVREVRSFKFSEVGSKEISMKRSAIRTLIILSCGAVMALAAYAGQTGYKDDDAVSSVELHTSTVDGYYFDYRIIYAGGKTEVVKEGQNQAKSPELILFITDPDGRKVSEAMVKYTVAGPRGCEMKARGLPVQGGYGTDMYCDIRGDYCIKAEAILPEGTLTDNFIYEIR